MRASGTSRGDGGPESALGVAGSGGGEASLAKVVEEEGPVMADEDLMKLPSLDITGDGGPRVMAED